MQCHEEVERQPVLDEWLNTTGSAIYGKQWCPRHLAYRAITVQVSNGHPVITGAACVLAVSDFLQRIPCDLEPVVTAAMSAHVEVIDDDLEVTDATSAHVEVIDDSVVTNDTDMDTDMNAEFAILRDIVSGHNTPELNELTGICYGWA